jgi:uncharacterized protein (TIGR02231 family)
MKHLFSLILFVCCTQLALANDKEIIKSTLGEVTVYAQGAQLYHKANYTVKAGITEVVIEGISPHIDINSLQVKASGSVVILDAKYSMFYPRPDEVTLESLPAKTLKDIQLLEDSLKLLGYELQDLQDEIDVLFATKNILANNGAVRGQGKVNDSINLLKQTMDYYAVKMVEINKKLSTLNRKKEEKLEKKQRMQERLLKLRRHQSSTSSDANPDGPIPQVIITISANEAVSGKLNISYLVSNAGWIPMYDLRSDGLTSKINLTYKAKVFQNSGLDWENVKLNISTNNPFQNKTKPTLHPWYIDYYNYQQDLRSYKSIQMEGQMAPSMAKEAEAKGYAYTNSTRTMEDLDDAQTSAQFVQVVRQLTSAEFKIDLPYTIKSDNQQHLVLIKVADLDASYTYYSIPKLDNGVYLVAQLSKLDELGLVPAQANIFFDGSYVGETYIDPTTMEDTLDLSLGRDPNIVVKRTLLKKDCKEKIIGDKKERTQSYSIEVRNLKATSIDLIIQDQLPITQNADITIEKIDIGKGTYEESSGMLEWKVSLKSKEDKIIPFSYRVKHNKDQQISL